MPSTKLFALFLLLVDSLIGFRLNLAIAIIIPVKPAIIAAKIASLKKAVIDKSVISTNTANLNILEFIINSIIVVAESYGMSFLVLHYIRYTVDLHFRFLFSDRC